MFIKFIILFVFVFALLSFNIPQLAPSDFIKFKMYIFCGIFLFELISDILTKLYHQQIIDLVQIIKSSLQSGLVAVVAYGMYNDLAHGSCPLADTIDTNNKDNLIISIIIIIGIGINYFIERIFLNLSPKINDRLNTIYPNK